MASIQVLVIAHPGTHTILIRQHNYTTRPRSCAYTTELTPPPHTLAEHHGSIKAQIRLTPTSLHISSQTPFSFSCTSMRCFASSATQDFWLSVCTATMPDASGHASRRSRTDVICMALGCVILLWTVVKQGSARPSKLRDSGTRPRKLASWLVGTCITSYDIKYNISCYMI